MMNAGNLKGKTRLTSDWRRRMIAFVSALTLLISSCGLTAFAESDEDIYSAPVTAPIPAANTSPEPEEGGAEATPAPEGLHEEGTEPQEPAGESTGEGTETEGEPEVSEEPEDLTVYEPGTLTAEADGVGITVDYTAEARVPEGTVLTLTRAAGGDLYTALKSASKVLKTEENATWKREIGEDAVFYAAALTNPEGNEVHPETGVTLTCTNLEIPANATGFVTGDKAENLDWKDTLTVEFLPDAIGYAYLKQVQIGTVTLTHEDRDYMVTAAYGPDAGFPADTELKVREIKPGTPEYALYSGMTDEALNEDWAEITLERYFDITFVANGQELEPKADVDVQIVFRDKIEQNEETEVAAVHIENNEANVIEADTDSTKSAKHDDEAIDTVTFSCDSFSVYGVVQKKKIITKVLAADGNTYEIEISYTQEAEIPEESQVKVEEIPEGSDLWEAYRKQTAAALNADDVRLPGLYDISIIDAEGAKIEPKAPVSVSIKLANAEANNEDLHVVHFTEEIPQELVEAEAKSEEQTEVQTEEQTAAQSEPLAEEDKIASEKITATVEDNTVTFETQSFSVYAFAYTVDFYYGEYEYHLEGGTFMSLKNLLTVLHIVEADQVQEFVNNIAEVTFSNPALLSVSKVEEDTTAGAVINKLGLEPGYSVFLSEEEIAAVNNTAIKAVDWALISLKAFTTHESLIIVMNNGDRYTITVDDYQEDFIGYVNYKDAGYIAENGKNHMFLYSTSNHEYSFVFDVQTQNGQVIYFKHRNDKSSYGIRAVANPNYEFAFWVVVKSDKSFHIVRTPELATGDMLPGSKCIACFVRAGNKLIVMGEPEPSEAWYWASAQHWAYDDSWRDLRYCDNTENLSVQTNFDNAYKYNFLGWFDGDTLLSQGGWNNHNYSVSDVDHHMVLTPKYELKEEYRTYRFVWLDGSDGVSSNVGDSTTLARINGSGVREGAGQEMVQVNAGQKYTLPSTVSFNKPLSDNLHHYAIDGWYDTRTGNFYAPGTEVTIDHDTVFYASWFPENYNFATGSGAIATRDTSSFIDMHLYDYNSIYNMKWLNLTSSYITSSGHYEEWTMKGDTNEFIFLTTAGQWGRSINPHGRTIKNSNNEAGADNNHYNAWSAHIPMPGDLTNGTVPGVKSVGSANYLFRYDNTTGYYYYDSSKNKAAYGINRFYVYNGTERTEPNYGTSDFLPFNDGQAEYNEPQGQPNYWFGMDTRIHFYLPDAPGTQVNGQTGNRSTKGDEMVYKFSGDDDVWVYLDDVLVLNMSGVHGLIYGEINLSQGTYTMAEGGTTKTVDSKGIMTYGTGGTITHGNLSDISGLSSKLTSGSHTIRMVYLERGASQSNCAIYFNLAPKTQKLKIRKVTDLDKGIYKHTVKDAEFQIYTESDYLNGGQPINPSETKQVAEMTGYYYGQTFVSDDVGRFFWGELPPGVYYIVETKAPHGLETLSDPIRMEINDTDGKIYYGPVSADNPAVFLKKYTKDTSDSTKYVDIYVNNSIEKGSIQVEKNWDVSLASTEAVSKAILFRLERTPETDTNSDGISGNGYGNDGNNGIYYAPESYGLTSANIYEQDGTKYLKLNKNGNTWETLTISNLPMACVSAEKDQDGNQAVVPCYYRVVETGYLGTDDMFHAIDPNLITVTYTATNAVDDNGRTAILAKDDAPDTLTITNRTDFTNVEVQKLWANDSPYADSVTVKLYRSVDAQAQTVVSINTTVHLSVTLTDADSKATAVTAHINGQDITLTKNGNVYTGDAVVPKGADYGITFTGTATDGYSVVIDNGEILVGQNDEQNYATTGIVNAPVSVAQTRNITLTINWTGDDAWNHGNIWAQVWDSEWTNSKGFNSLFSQGHTTATAVGVSTGADVVQLGGGFIYDNYEYSLNPSAQYAKNGDDILIFNVPAGTEDVSYELTITPKTTTGTNINDDGTMTINLYARNINGRFDNWEIRNDSSGGLHSTDNQKYYNFSSIVLNKNCSKTSVTVSAEDVQKYSQFVFGYSSSNVNDLRITYDSPYVRISGNMVTITSAAVEIDIYFYSDSTGGSLLRPLRFRAEAGASSGAESPVITTIALNHDAASASTSITGNENWPAVSDMEQVGDAVVLTAGSGNDDDKSWYYKWENLPAVDENGRAYHYYVIEDVPVNTDQAAYSRTETPSLTNITITNTPTEIPDYATFSVKKVVDGVTTNRDFFIKLKREKNSTTEWLNRTDADTWNWGNESSATEFTFKDGETLRFTGLDIGYTYTAVENTSTDKIEVSGYSYDLAGSTTTASATIADAASANPDTVTITNKYETPVTGTVKVKKVVSGAAADETNREFNFTFSILDSSNEVNTSINGTLYEHTFENGVATFSLQNNTEETFSNLPLGLKYRIAEAADPLYRTTATIATGSETPIDADLPVVGTISGDSTVNIQFTNTRIQTVNIEATKSFAEATKDYQKPAAIEFTLYQKIGSAEPAIVSITGIQNPVVIVPDGNAWTTAEWLNLPKYVDENVAENEKQEYVYSVKETGLYFGSVDSNNEPDDLSKWEKDADKIAAMFTVTDGAVTYSVEHLDQGSTEILNTPKLINIPVIKTWPDYSGDEYTWTVTFRLKQQKIPADGSSTLSEEWETVADKTVVAEKGKTPPAFEDLDLFKFEDGVLYKMIYSVDEIEYVVTPTGGGEPVIRWSEDQTISNIPETGTYYHLRYDHIAGEESESADDLYKIRVENRIDDYSNKLVVRKEWLDMLEKDEKYYPDVYFTLFRTQAGNNLEQAEICRPEGTNDEDYVLSYENGWVRTFGDLDEGYVYFVVETPKEGNGSQVGQAYVGTTVKTYPDYNDGYVVTLNGYRARDTYGTGSWKIIEGKTYALADKPHLAYTGNTGEIVIENKAPHYMQMDIKKKFLRYDENGSLWTDTGTPYSKTNHVIEVILLRRAVELGYTSNWSNSHKVLDYSEVPNYQIAFDWEQYGEPILVGYEETNKDVCVNPNSFYIRYAGDWHWTIDNQDQNKGLLGFGYYQGPNDTEPRLVEYQYVIKEINAYKNTKREALTDYAWEAILPAAWSGAGYQVYLFPKVEGQDQDRLVNVQGTNIIINKAWTSDASSDEVYVKIYRNKGQNISDSSLEDYTSIINRTKLSYMGIGQDGYTEASNIVTIDSQGNIYTDDNHTGEKYIRVPSNGSVLISRVLVLPPAGERYYYWVEECGYKGSDGKAVMNLEKVQPVSYSIGTSKTNQNLINGKNNKQLGGSDPIELAELNKNVFTITNTSKTTGSLKIAKHVLFNGNQTTDPKLNGTYTFTVSSDTGILPAVNKTVTITIENGVAKTFTIDGGSVQTIPTDGYVEITDLPAGDYVISEGEADTVLYSITGGKDDGDTENRTITATVTSSKEGTAILPAGMVVFTNNLPEATAVIEGIKTVKNKKSTDDASGYTFTLSAEDSGVPMPESPGNAATSTADGSITFGTITYNVDQVMTAGTRSDKVYTAVYSYTVNEELPAGNTATDDDRRNGYKIIENIKYDLTPKTVTVTVTYNEETGVMATSVDPSKAGLEFENEVLGKITVTKTVKLNGTPTGSLGKSFWVALYENNSGSAGELVGKRIININNEGIGSVEFTDLPAGKYLAYELTDENGTPVTENSAVIGEFTYLDITTDNSDAEITADKLDGSASIENCAYTTSITVKKVTTDNNFLAGAAFKIVKVKDAQGTEYSTGEQGAWESEPKEITTEDGVDFEDLEVGHYKLIETQVPAGYLALTENIIFEVSKEEGKDTLTITDQSATNEMHKFEEEAGEYLLTVSNEAGAELPATGGTGTLPYTITGIFLITLAGVLLVSRKRKANR